MNELTGAFIRARERGENSNITRQSLANAGYTIPEIEEAYRESVQMLSSPIPVVPTTQKEGNKKTKLLWLLLVFLILILAGASLIMFLNYREGADVFSTRGFSVISEFLRGLFKKA